MAARQTRRDPAPLTATKLEELAISYVGRFATSRAKLVAYLSRKLKERGWVEGDPPCIDKLADRLVDLGYVDDQSYAMAKARSLTAKGYGGRRVRQALFQAGIGEGDASSANELVANDALAAALRFARRKAIGPYASAIADRPARQRAIAAMIRAGHDFDLARTVVDLAPGELPHVEERRNLD